VAGALVLSACGGLGIDGGERAATTATVLPVNLTAVPIPGATEASLDKPVTISVTEGTLSAVSVSAPDGPLAGKLTPDATSWASTGTLVPSTTYQVAATVVDTSGGTTPQQWEFTTGGPSIVFKATLSPGDNATVGVGMPVVVKLSVAVAPADRAAFVKHLTVTSSPAQNGAWRWFSDKELHWRPAVYWTAGTKVTVKAAVAGYNAGGGAWGVKDVTTNYSIGDAHVSKVDTQTHQMAVTNNGAVVKMFPVSTGNTKYPTKSGIHVTNEKLRTTTMDSATVGIPRNSPDGYYETVEWNVRISNSGEFVHAAPWSVDSQGRANVSHGCVNASPTDAEWFYNFSWTGDVVEVVGSPEQLEPTNGIGDWQIPWANWAN
jgi:lipoprotein-anchoring transpeptidase ErfK/SrfK